MNAPFLMFAVLPVLVVITLGAWDKIIPTCCGIGAAIASFCVETPIDHAFTAYGLPLTGGQKAFILFGLTEEGLKYLSLAMASRLHQSGRQVVQNGIFCAIGFASVENLLYTMGFWRALGDTGAFGAASLLRL
jgi:RsiW-degrading membrane proteinase PrsW (M82 family)